MEWRNPVMVACADALGVEYPVPNIDFMAWVRTKQAEYNKARGRPWLDPIPHDDWLVFVGADKP